MATQITDEQRITLRKNVRFQDMTKITVQNYATFIAGNDGNPPPGAMTPVDWALQRFFLAESIVQNPTSQDIEPWISQMLAIMKDDVVWVDDAAPPALPGDATVDFMITNNLFTPLAEQVFALRAKNVRFS